MKLLLMRLLAALTVLACLRAPADGSPFWAENFTIPAVDGTVNAIAETADAFYCGGSFSSVGAVAARNVVRVDKATGAVSALGSPAQNGTGGVVSALVVMGADLYVAGSFTTVSSSAQNAIAASRIAKWDTVAKTWSPLGSVAQNGVSGPVNALAVVAGDVFVGGSFTAVSSAAQPGIFAGNVARWSPAGGTWTPLGSAAQNGTNANVNALAVSGANVFVGGAFGSVSSGTQNAIFASSVARWDTAAAAWFPLGSAGQNGVGGTVNALAVRGADVFAGGFFTTVSSGTQAGVSASSVAKWDTAAGLWSPLGSATQNGADGTISALAVSGGDVFVGGLFTVVRSSAQGAVAVSRIAKWDSAGSAWALLGSAAQNGTNNRVNALAVSGGDLLVGGAFTVAAGTHGTSGVAKWSTGGSAWAAAVQVNPGDGIIGSVSAVLDAGAVVYVGGSFSFAGSVPANNIACWNKASRTWSALGSAAQNGTGGGVSSLAMVGADLFVAGGFTTASSTTQNAISASRVAKWDPVAGTWSPLGSPAQNGVSGTVNTIAAIGAGLFVGGNFNAVNSSTQSGVSAKNIARWSIPLGTWSALGSETQNGTFGQVLALAADGADLYVGGAFTTASSSGQNAISASRVARWSVAGNAWTVLGSAGQNGANGTVRALAMSGTSLYVGGDFLNVSSSTQFQTGANQIAKWDPASGTWSRLGSASQNGTSDGVFALSVGGAELYAGGQFVAVSSSTQNGIAAGGVAKWDETGGTWSPLGGATQNGTNGVVVAMAVAGGDVFAAGIFSTASSATQNAIFSSRFGRFGPAPQVTVEQPVGTFLPDGSATIAFASAGTGIPSAPTTFTITNSGTADLTLGAIGKDGANAGDFAVSSPLNATVTPGNSTTFSVTFTPSAAGVRTAAIHIASNVTGTTNPFDITLTGSGPDIAGPTGGTMTLGPASRVDAAAPLTVTFSGWNDPSAPLSYSVLIDGVEVSGQGPSASRNFTGPTTPGAHILKGRIHDALDNVTEVTRSFTVNTALESWRLLHFGTTADSGDAANAFDYEFDGLANLVEFAFGLHPKSGASLQLPQGQIVVGDFFVSFTQPAGVSGIAYSADWCPDLVAADWQPVPDTGIGSVHTFSVPIGSNLQMFMRLKVTPQ